MLQFGFDTRELEFSAGRVRILTLPDLNEKVEQMRATVNITALHSPRREWAYASRPRDPSRYFSLPRTHAVEVNNADCGEHEEFHVNAFSFFQGHRLSYFEHNGYIDAVPIVTKGNKYPLVDFELLEGADEEFIGLSERFWQTYKDVPQFSMRFQNIIWSLFLSRRPWLTGYEAFSQTYEVLEAYWKLFVPMANRESPNTGIRSGTSHGNRLKEICGYYGLPTHSDWIEDVVKTRNLLEHESVVAGQSKWFFDGFFFHHVFPMRRLIDRLVLSMILGKQQASAKQFLPVAPEDVIMTHRMDVLMMWSPMYGIVDFPCRKPQPVPGSATIGGLPGTWSRIWNGR